MNTDLSNVAHLDRYTIGHAVLGFVAARAGLSLPWTALIAIGWELAEDDLKVQFPKIFPEASADSKANALTDVVAVVGGHVAGRASKL
jgi:hypothetical protein